MNSRIRWDQLPPEVRDGVEHILGEPVASTQSQPGGFSPGSADRVVLSSGRRAFVKAVSAGVNPSSMELHRREAAVTAALPAGVSAPKILGKYDDGTWVALVLADVAGRHPQEPWQQSELARVLGTLADMGRLELPAEAPMPPYQESLEGAFRGWEKLLARPLADMPAWAGEHLGELAGLARAGLAALAGDALVHGDLRADNILLTADGTVFLDWPWAARGAPWVDALSVLLNVKTLDPAANVDQWLAGHPVFAGAAPEAVSAVLAGWAGYFLDMSRRPAPPGIPTLRAFQRKQADVLISWLEERLAT